MDWTLWILASAATLAVYDLLKKESVRGNAVLPVLIIATAAGAAAYSAALAAFGDLSAALNPGARALMLAALKSVIVGTSWLLTYSALKTLPITIATPIRASAPAIVVLAAVLLYGERPSAVQWAGMAAVFAGFAGFSWAGKAEGVDFLRSKAVWCAVGGMLTSAVSSLFDKYVFQAESAPVESVQFWFQTGLLVFYAVIAAVRKALGGAGDRFEWRAAIPFVGVALALSDWLYFNGLATPGVPISVGSLMRRLSVVITFAVGAALFRERNLKRKSPMMALIALGVAVICLGRWLGI